MKMKFIYTLFFLIVFQVSAYGEVTKHKITEDQKIFLTKRKSERFIMGHDISRVKIFIYGSFSCSHCSDFFLNTVPRIIKNYNDKQVSVIFRSMFIDLPSLRATQLLKCSSTLVNDRKYLLFIRTLYKNTNKFLYNENFLEILSNLYAQELNQSKISFEKCITSKDIEKESIEEQYKIGSQMQLVASPAIFINDILVYGNVDFKNIKMIIDSYL